MNLIFCYERNAFILGIDVQASFNNDQVKISLDGTELLDELLETNQVLGLCYDKGQFSGTIEEGEHTITVVVNSESITETFQVSNDTYIGINYNEPAGEISIIYAGERFMYD